jgi:hypothetical protein
MGKELGAEIKPRNLYGSRVDREISKLTRNYLLLLFSSLAIVLTVFGLQLDKLLTYGFIGSSHCHTSTEQGIMSTGRSRIVSETYSYGLKEKFIFYFPEKKNSIQLFVVYLRW